MMDQNKTIYTLEQLAADDELKSKPVYQIDLYHPDWFGVVLEENDSVEEIEEWVEKQRGMLKLLMPDRFEGLCNSRKIADNLLAEMWSSPTSK